MAVLVIAHNTEDARLVLGSGIRRIRVWSFRVKMIEEEDGLEGGVWCFVVGVGCPELHVDCFGTGVR